MNVRTFASRVRDDASRFMVAWMKTSPLYEDDLTFVQWLRAFISFINEETRKRKRKKNQEQTQKKV